MKTNKVLKWLGRFIPIGAVLCLAFGTYSYFRDDRLISTLSTIALGIFLSIVGYRSYLWAKIHNDPNYKVYAAFMAVMVVATILMIIGFTTQFT
jgi:hypothetical protein